MEWQVGGLRTHGTQTAGKVTAGPTCWPSRRKVGVNLRDTADEGTEPPAAKRRPLRKPGSKLKVANGGGVRPNANLEQAY